MNCELCNRDIELTKHHLIPRKLHTKKKFKRLKINLNECILICRDCHDNLHVNYSEKDLGEKYNTLDEIKKLSKVSSYTKWLKNR